MTRDEKYIAALRRERLGYVGRDDMKDRLSAVDAELARMGVGPDGEPLKEDRRSTPPVAPRPPGKRRTA